MLDSSHKTIATGVVLKVGKGLHAFGVDEAAGARVALWQIAFSGWVTLSARKWVISRERRGPLASRVNGVARPSLSGVSGQTRIRHSNRSLKIGLRWAELRGASPARF